MRRTAAQTAAALATLTAALALWRIGHALLLLALAITFAASANVGAAAILRHHVSRRWAFVLVYGSALVVLATTLYCSLSATARELSRASDELQHGYSRLRAYLPAQGQLARELARQLPDPSLLLDGSALGAVARSTLGLTQDAFAVGAEIVIVIVLSLLWTLSAEPFERLWLSLLPAASRSRIHHAWQRLRDRLGLEVCSQLGQSVLIVWICGLTFRFLDLPYPVLAALAIGILRLIPLLGPVLSALVAVASGSSRGLPWSAAALAITLTTLVFLRVVIAERLLGARRLNPLLLGATLIALWEAGGFVALLVGAPVAAALGVVGAEWTSRKEEPAVGNELENLLQRYAELDAMGKRSSTERPRLQGLLARLGSLIVEARAHSARRGSSRQSIDD